MREDLTEDILQVDGQVCVMNESCNGAKCLRQTQRQQLCIDGFVREGVQQRVNVLSLLGKPPLGGLQFT